jgi:hypothetical protein
LSLLGRAGIPGPLILADSGSSLAALADSGRSSLRSITPVQD